MQLFVTNKMHCDFLCGRQKACLSAEFGKLGNGEQGSYGAWKSLNSMEFHLLKIKALKAWNFINWHGKPGILTSRISNGGRASHICPPGGATCCACMDPTMTTANKDDCVAKF